MNNHLLNILRIIVESLFRMRVIFIKCAQYTTSQVDFNLVTPDTAANIHCVSVCPMKHAVYGL